jgi:localization factor PodJL
MDQQSVESLLRRLVQRVEESERRYSEALDELHARLDQLAQTTNAARAAETPDDTATFDRLHDEVSSLARRLEREASNPLDDFERLGRALAGDLNYAASLGGAHSSTPDPLGSSDFPSLPSEPPRYGGLPSHFPLPDVDYSRPAPEPMSSPAVSDSELDSRLAEMAHQLEHSVGTPMPPALDALSARLDEIGRDLAKALATPKTLSLEPVERQISEMTQQLNRAEAQLAKIGEIESALLKLIERIDASPSPDEVADKAAEKAARLVADEAKPSTATIERLDAMHRDLVAMNDRSTSSDDKLAGTIEAVHASLKQLAQQVERAAPPPAPALPAASAPAAKPRVPFAERVRDLAPLPGTPSEQDDARKSAETNGRKDAVDKAKAATPPPDFAEPEIAPHFGRARRGSIGEQAFDLDAPTSRRTPAKPRLDAEYDVPDDLVAAARRAAQAAAAKAEERGSGSRLRRLPGDGDSTMRAELPARRKRSFLIICAAVLLAISAALLYSRLRSKPEPEMTPPAAEQSMPAPAAPSEGAAPDGAAGTTPEAVEPTPQTPATPGSSELQWEPEVTPAPNDAADSGARGNFTDVAKSPRQPADGEMAAQAQPASLTQDGPPALPPGVVFSVEGPTIGGQQQTPAAPVMMPMSLPVPPADLGPLQLRQAAAQGDARAQYAIALRYAQGQGTPQNLTEAVRWFERAAGAGFAPAQYRLAVLYERGQGVAKDLGRARSWYQAAAEKGNVKSMHNLAVSASSSKDGGADYALAAKWYGEAAGYGLADSQFNLGVLEEHGLGMPKNLANAYKWFAIAAKNGDEEAAKRRDLVKRQLDAATLAAADQAIAAWTPKQAAPEANEIDEPQDWAEGTEASDAPNLALVNRAQALLNKLGYDVGVPDGLMGAKTRDAIKSFERRNGLEETGKVTIPLVAKLERVTG